MPSWARPHSEILYVFFCVAPEVEGDPTEAVFHSPPIFYVSLSFSSFQVEEQ